MSLGGNVRNLDLSLPQNLVGISKEALVKAMVLNTDSNPYRIPRKSLVDHVALDPDSKTRAFAENPRINANSKERISGFMKEWIEGKWGPTLGDFGGEFGGNLGEDLGKAYQRENRGEMRGNRALKEEDWGFEDIELNFGEIEGIEGITFPYEWRTNRRAAELAKEAKTHLKQAILRGSRGDEGVLPLFQVGF